MLDKDVDVVVPSGETGSFTQTPSTSPLYSHQPAKPTHHAKSVQFFPVIPRFLVNDSCFELSLNLRFTSYPSNYHRIETQVTVSTPETSSFGGEIM
ncbi:hypothetical protein O5D80_003128 [Batrachochytrium dendrobatidis]|nr:hypothetical protein O5D80_003128 [Batrachochytrium dendrobatidis]